MTILNSYQINQIKRDLEFLSEFSVLLFGSVVKGDYIEGRSDIDVAIITRNQKKAENIKIWDSFVGRVAPKYDIRIFELFPLYIQIEIIQNYIVIFGDPIQLSEYFYNYRKDWDEMKERVKANQFKNAKEKQAGIERRKKYLTMKGLQ